jgi:hypothetical protein
MRIMERTELPASLIWFLRRRGRDSSVDFKDAHNTTMFGRKRELGILPRRVLSIPTHTLWARDACGGSIFYYSFIMKDGMDIKRILNKLTNVYLMELPSLSLCRPPLCAPHQGICGRRKGAAKSPQRKYTRPVYVCVHIP